MRPQALAFSDDIAGAALVVTLALLGFSLLMLFFELRQRERGGVLILLSGLLASAMCALAVLRPVIVEAKTNTVGPRVAVLIDQSRRMALPAGEQTRQQRALQAARALGAHYREARLTALGFAGSEVKPLTLGDETPELEPAPGSDLLLGLQHALHDIGERPSAVVVIGDGRLTRPGESVDEETLKRAFPDVVVHTVSVLDTAPRDASIRSVRAVGAAVAHQPLTLTVEVGCQGLRCGEIPVEVRELRDSVEPATLASGKVKVDGELGKVELEITLDRAGARVVEIAIQASEGDTIADNDRRLITFEVARDRVRLLHLAGRPTHDVRALRLWLERDQSVDVVAFFILRGNTDNPNAGEKDLALIRFPVDELFTEHLSSFDAVILQDIDAEAYKLAQYLLRLAQYVKTGGGLIMVGGPASFAGGKYAGTAIDEILPVEQPRGERPFDAAEFLPVYTEAGEAAAVTQGLRELLQGELPSLAGANFLGAPRPGAIVLWQHPTLKAGTAPMPVLALGEAGDGRSIALAADSTHRLAFGQIAAMASGRAYGALWDGLLGWLMRDPRYEAARVSLVGECVAERPAKLRVVRLPGMQGKVRVELKRLSSQVGAPKIIEAAEGAGNDVIDLGALEVGGYTAKVHIGDGPPTRYDFGCEKGGEAWSDTRPDAERLQRIAKAAGGKAVAWDEIDELPAVETTEIIAERHTSPILPAWGWTLCAAVALGAHWLARRHGGLS